MIEVEQAIEVTLRLLAGAFLYSGFEVLALHRCLAARPLFGASGPGAMSILLLAGLQMSGAMLLFVSPAGLPGITGVCCMVSPSMLLQRRVPFGGEGAIQLGHIAGVSLVLALLEPSPANRDIVAWFLSLQLVLAYVTAGVGKFRNPAWRDGSFLFDVLGTRLYGFPPLRAWLGGSTSIRVVANLIAIIECATPLMLLLGGWFAYAYLTILLLFHVGNWIAMGLPLFALVFPALYPLVLSCVG